MPDTNRSREPPGEVATLEAAPEAAAAADLASAPWSLEGGAVPLYLKAAKLIERRIREGALAVGSLLPTELDLAERLGVSRQTIRQAIALLRSQGLLSARKGVGTRVEATPSATRHRYTAQSVADLVDFARETEMRIIEREMVAARGRLAAELGCRPGRTWLHIAGPRYRHGSTTPFSWNEVYLDGRLAPILHDVDRLSSALFVLIEDQSGEHIVEIKQEIRAAVLDQKHGQWLGAAAGDLALQVTRRYLASGGRLVEHATMLLPADRYSFSMSFRPEGE